MKTLGKRIGVLVLALTMFLAVALSAGAAYRSEARIKVDDIDWTTNPIVINSVHKTRIDISVLDKIAKEYANVPVIVESNHYAYTFPAGALYVNTLLGYVEFGLEVQYSEYERDAGVNSNVKALRKLSADPSAVVVNFYQDGKLAAAADVVIQVGPQNAGKTMGYYFYNPNTAKFEFQQNTTVDANGWATVKQTHGGSYIFTTANLVETTPTTVTVTPTTNPTTGPK